MIKIHNIEITEEELRRDCLAFAKENEKDLLTIWGV
jgi:hypothetical protein